MATKTINGVEIFYEDTGGDGEVILFHHGYTGSHDGWPPIIDKLRGRYRCVMVDGRGAGDSGRPSGGYTLAQYAADVIGLVDSLGIDRFTYVGHSMGGGVGYLLGLDHASRLDRLVLVAPIPSGGVGSRAGTREAARAVWLARDEDELFRQGRLGLARPERVDDAVTKNRVARALSVSLGHYDDSWADMVAFDVTARLGSLTTPTLMVAGAADALARANVTDYLLLPNATLHVFHRVGHLVPIEVPGEFAELIDDFMVHGPITAATLAERIAKG